MVKVSKQTQEEKEWEEGQRMHPNGKYECVNCDWGTNDPDKAERHQTSPIALSDYYRSECSDEELNTLRTRFDSLSTNIPTPQLADTLKCTKGRWGVKTDTLYGHTFWERIL